MMQLELIKEVLDKIQAKGIHYVCTVSSVIKEMDRSLWPHDLELPNPTRATDCLRIFCFFVVL
jgi:hypothetical protein